MTNEQRIKNLSVPSDKIDVVLDTDAYNEIDDQFAIAYMLKSKEKLNTKAIYAAPLYIFLVNIAKILDLKPFLQFHFFTHLHT